MDIIETSFEIMAMADAITAMASSLDHGHDDDVRQAAAALKLIACQIVTLVHDAENKE